MYSYIQENFNFIKHQLGDMPVAEIHRYIVYIDAKTCLNSCCMVDKEKHKRRHIPFISEGKIVKLEEDSVVSPGGTQAGEGLGL